MARGVVSHPGNHVGIGVECDRDCGMAEELLDVLGCTLRRCDAGRGSGAAVARPFAAAARTIFCAGSSG
jgi:hypothetical protein